MFIIRPYLETDLEDVIALWEVCDLTRPWNNPEIDIFRKTAQKDGLFLLAVKDEQLIATLMGGYDGHRGWINYWRYIHTFNAMESQLHSYSSSRSA